MSRGLLRTATVASVIALAFAAPAAVDAATTTCAKQARAVASAKKAVTKAQKAKASTPAARKQRAKRVKAAKAKHTRAKKTLAACRAKGKSAPVPAPAPEPTPVPVPLPAPAPAPPVLSLATTTVVPLQGFTVTVAAPPLLTGMQYRVVYDLSPVAPGATNCTSRVIWSNVPAEGQKVLFGSRPWCVGSGTVALHRAPNDAHPSVPGDLVLAIPIVVNPA